MPQCNFADRVAVVTGAGRGLGRSYAKELARRGARVVVNDIGSAPDGRPSAQSVVDEIREAGGIAVTNVDSVTDPGGPEKIVGRALDAFGHLDCLVNNAGIVRGARFEKTAAAELDAIFSSHLKGSFFVAQYAYREMQRSGYGRIVNTSSSAGVFGHAHQSAYGAAKAALVGLTNVLALEGRPHGILVNAVLPVAETKRAGPSMPNAEAARLVAELGSAASRMSPEFVAPLVVFLCSEACTTTHGVYSAVAGRYARVFTGVTAGWASRSEEPPSAEEVAGHLDLIEDRSDFAVPMSVADELALVGRQAAGRAHAEDD